MLINIQDISMLIEFGGISLLIDLEAYQCDRFWSSIHVDRFGGIFVLIDFGVLFMLIDLEVYQC